MALDLELLGSKLQRYREQFQVELREVSAATGIPVETLRSFEQARAEPTGDQILILADYYKCDYRFFISNEQLAAFEQTESLFRSHASALSKEDRWAIQEFLFLCECEEFLMANLPGHERGPFAFAKTGTFYKGHGEQAAAALRAHLGYDARQIPQNVYRDFRRIGLHVFRRRLGNSNVSGLFVKHPVAGKCLLVNYSEDIYRQRFSAAHEAGHALLDEDRDFGISFEKWDHSDLSEVRANTFASRYLLPPDSLRRLPDPRRWQPEDIAQWATKLMVNTEPLAIALNEAGLVSDEAARVIRQEKIPRHVKRDPELPGALAKRSRERKAELLRRGLSDFYVSLCFDAYETNLVSSGRLAEMLLVDERELRQVADLYGRGLAYGD